MKNLFSSKNHIFCVQVPIHTTIVKYPYFVKNGMKYGPFSSQAANDFGGNPPLSHWQ